jgi:predicted AAA+ superfamily ATPase
MLQELIDIHHFVTSTTETQFTRYLYDAINWDNRAICIMGHRGVGKTTLMLQHCLAHYPSVDKGLYLSADNIHVLGNGLFNIAKHFFMQGGEILFVDEVHKYPNWSIEIKNIIDTFKTKKLVFSGSSSLDLTKSKGDLSRRVVYYELKGLSFREYLSLSFQKTLPVFSLESILTSHTTLIKQIHCTPILKHFRDYLAHGYYPFFKEGIPEFFHKLDNVIEKVIWEDIATVHQLKQNTLPVLKKLLWLTATSNGFKPNIDKISKNLQVSREAIYHGFHYLNNAGLIINLLEPSSGMKLIRKPAKVFLNNTNLLHTINKNINLETNEGNLRETFFVNQLSALHKICIHDEADFIVDKKLIFEVGGQHKTHRQIQHTHNNGFLALDNIEAGQGKRIPLYLFGFLY